MIEIGLASSGFWRRPGSLLAGGLLLAHLGCGGGPSSPSSVTTLAIPAGTRLSFVSGETDVPVQGASVVVGGRTLTTDGAGQVTLPLGFASATPLDVVAGGFLGREAYLLPGTSRFTMWPQTSPTGLNEHVTLYLVYTDSSKDAPVPGGQPLERIRQPDRQAFLVPTAGILADPLARAAHEAAADGVSRSTSGALTYEVVSEKPAGSVAFTTSVSPADRSCKEDDTLLAYARIFLRGDEIVAGSIVYCSVEVSRTSTVTHEVGHTFGLGHSPDAKDLMYAFEVRRGPRTFTSREALVMSLMLQRKAGNRFPDSERGAAGSSAGRTLLFLCH